MRHPRLESTRTRTCGILVTTVGNPEISSIQVRTGPTEAVAPLRSACMTVSVSVIAERQSGLPHTPRAVDAPERLRASTRMMSSTSGPVDANTIADELT